MKENIIAPFFGAFSALDPRSIPSGAASDHLNVRVEDGSIKFRYGYRNLAAAGSGFTAVHGMAYVQGFTGTTENEEYITVETRSGNTRPYSRAHGGSTGTEITNGGVSVSLNASEWVFSIFDDYCYLINPNNSSAPVYRHLIGTNNDLTALAIPTDPTVAPTYVVDYGPGGSTNYSQLDFTGIDPTNSGEVACTGAATNTGSSLLSDNSLSIRHTNSRVESSITIDLADGPGNQDWTYRDKFAVALTCETNLFGYDPGVRFELINNDGSPKTLIPTSIKRVTNSARPAGTSGLSNAYYFDYIDKTRADFDNIRYLKITYTVTTTSSTVANNDLIISKPYIGGVDLVQSPPDRTPGSAGLYLAYTYRFSTPGFESGLSPVLFIPNSVLLGTNPYTGLPPLGLTLELTATVSSDGNVDQVRFYVLDNIDNVMRLLATQADSDLTYNMRSSYPEIHRLSEISTGPFIFLNAVNMFAYKGHAVWLYDTGSENVRYSRNGEPLQQASAEDATDDTAAGETFTLADGGSDKPLIGIQAGDAVMIGGKYGIHCQIGDRAVEMTPPRRVAGSQGIAGKYAACRYKDDNGVVGLAYMTPDGQVMFSIPGAFNDKEVGGTVNLTELVRDGELSPKDFLLEEQAAALSLTDFSTCNVVYDDQQDALWVVMGLRAMVLRRANLISGARYWEHYEYTTGSSSTTIRYVSGSGKRRLRWIRSSGLFDEAEYNSSTRAFISGSNSDGGSAAPAGYWESKTFAGTGAVQVNYVDVERDDYTDTPTVTVYSADTTSGNAVAVASGAKGAKMWINDGGEWYRVRVSVAETYEPIRRLIAYESSKGQRIRP
jgi:hypothetical protein